MRRHSPFTVCPRLACRSETRICIRTRSTLVLGDNDIIISLRRMYIYMKETYTQEKSMYTYRAIIMRTCKHVYIRAYL